MTNGTKWETYPTGKRKVHIRQTTTGKFIMLQSLKGLSIDWIKFRPNTLPHYNNRKDVLVYSKPHPYTPRFVWSAYLKYGNGFKSRVNAYPRLQRCKVICREWGRIHGISYKMKGLR